MYMYVNKRVELAQRGIALYNIYVLLLLLIVRDATFRFSRAVFSSIIRDATFGFSSPSCQLFVTQH